MIVILFTNCTRMFVVPRIHLNLMLFTTTLIRNRKSWPSNTPVTRNLIIQLVLAIRKVLNFLFRYRCTRFQISLHIHHRLYLHISPTLFLVIHHHLYLHLCHHHQCLYSHLRLSLPSLRCRRIYFLHPKVLPILRALMNGAHGRRLVLVVQGVLLHRKVCD